MRRAVLPQWLSRLARLAALCLCLAGMPGVRAQGVEIGTLELVQVEGALTLEFSARLSLSRALEDALRRGVPMYFESQATLYRGRWYWRDERIARVSRSVRLSYQPLTANWRISLGGLAQSYASLGEALAVVSRISGWRVAEASQLEPDQRYYVEFSYRLDNSQLPRPMQIGLGSDWSLGIERTLKLGDKAVEAAAR
jgi:hypothetical protein